MTLLDKIQYRLSGLLTRKRLVRLIDRYDHRFVIFQDKREESINDYGIFRFYITLKEKKKFWSINLLEGNKLLPTETDTSPELPVYVQWVRNRPRKRSP